MAKAESMAKPDQKRGSVVPLFRRHRDENVPEVVFNSRPQERSEAATIRPTAINLTDKPKVWMLIGTGKSGKTVEARWLVERMIGQGRSATLCALDPTTRSLSTWFPDQVEEPDGHAGRWLQSVLEGILEVRPQAIMDFGGGGETALAHCVGVAPDLHERLEEAGVGLVACYCLTKRIDDADVIGKFEDAGFRPQATALLLSPGPSSDSYEIDRAAFSSVMRHSSCRKALDRGAVPIWIPPLQEDLMQEIEEKRLTFDMAATGQIPEGAQFRPIGGLRRSMVGRWLRRMEESHRPIETWLP